MPVTGNHEGDQRTLGATCPNCDERLAGAFCSRCGQKAGGFNPPLKEFLHDAVHQLFDVDGRLFRSVRRLLTRPGFLTREHFEGRRVRYLAPLRLYLIFSVLYFATAALVGDSSGRAIDISFTETNPGELQALGYSSDEELERAIDFALTKGVPRAMFVLVPFFGGLVWLVNHRSGWRYPQHVYFALHVHAALFGIGILTEVAKLLPEGAARLALGGAAAVYQLGYVVLAQRRTYGTSAATSMLRTAAVGVIYLLAVMAAALAIVAPLFLSGI